MQKVYEGYLTEEPQKARRKTVCLPVGRLEPSRVLGLQPWTGSIHWKVECLLYTHSLVFGMEAVEKITKT